MKSRFLVVPTVVVMGIVIFLGFTGNGFMTDSARAEKNTWSHQAEETFYLSPGMGEKVMSRQQWDTFRKKMKDMQPEQLSSFRLEMHKSLMRDVHEKSPDVLGPVPGEGVRRQQDVSAGSGTPRLIFIAAAINTSQRAVNRPNPVPSVGLDGATRTSARSFSGAGSNMANRPSSTGRLPTGGLTSTPGATGGSFGSAPALVGTIDGLTPATPRIPGTTSSFPATGANIPSAARTPGTAGGFAEPPALVGTIDGLTPATPRNPGAASSFPATGANIPSTARTPGTAGGFAEPPALVGTIDGLTPATPGATRSSASSSVETPSGLPRTIDATVPGAAPTLRRTRDPSIRASAPDDNISVGLVPVASSREDSDPGTRIPGVVSSRDADRFFPSGAMVNTRRSVDAYDDSRGAIFNSDFDIGPADGDRNKW